MTAGGAAAGMKIEQRPVLVGSVLFYRRHDGMQPCILAMY